MISKLRAWDKTTNQMRGCYGFNELEQEVYVCNIADDDFNGQLKTVHAIKRSFDDVILMQSTGLKDKNGVEIFEGDVLTLKYYRDRRYTVTAKVIRGSQVTAMTLKFEDGFTTEEIPLYKITAEHSLEVMGNIYEHNHLIKE